MDCFDQSSAHWRARLARNDEKPYHSRRFLRQTLKNFRRSGSAAPMGNSGIGSSVNTMIRTSETRDPHVKSV
jgi:hypothetical protein